MDDENLSTTGSITAGSSFIIGNADINETDLEKIDGITDGTAVANKALVVDSNKDIGTIRNLTIDGVFTDGNYTFDTSGNVSGLGTVSSGAITSSSSITAGSFIIGDANINETDLEKIDGITNGTAVANKVLVVDSNKDIGTIRNLTIDGVLTDGNYTFDTSGNVSGLGTVSSGAITSSGSITSGSSFIIGNASINEADLEKIDDITDGTAVANKALVVDSNKDIGTIRNLTIDGVFTDGNYTFDTSGNVSGLGTVSSGAITSSGILTSATGSKIGNLTLANGSITDSSGAISFGNENLTTSGTLASGNLSVTGTGTFSSTITAATGSTVGNLTLANGSITDSSGAISFGNENLTTSGTLASGNLSVTGTGTFSSTISAATGSTVGNLTLANGSITDSSGAISFGNENLTTTGSITAGSSFIIGNADINETDLEKIDGITNGTAVANKALIVDSNKDIGTIRNLTIDGVFTDGNYTFDTSGNVSGLGTVSSGAITSSGILTAATGSIIGNLTLANGSITDSSGAISFGNENLTTSGTLASGNLSVTGTGTFSSTISAATGSTIGNMTLANGSITDTSGAISFGNENLSSTGTLSSGAITSSGSITSGSSFIIGSADINETDLEKIDGITDGTAAANKALVIDSNKDIGTIRNLTINGTFTDGTASLTSGALTGISSATISSSSPNLIVKSTNTSDGASLITMISDNADEAGDGFQFKSLNGVLTIASDHNSVGTYGETIMTITGHDTDASRSVAITGDLSSSTISMSDSNNINVGTGNDMTLYHDGSNSYITNKTGALKIATETSGIAVTIGHSTSEVTIGDNLTVTGNLAVSGTLSYSVLNAAVSTFTIEDKLLKIGQTNTGQSHDLGVIFTRGDGSSTNLANKGIIWDESADTFSFISCNTEDGTTNGNVTINNYESVRMDSITVDSASTFTSTISTATGSTIGNLTLANGSITDSSGAISFGNENLSTTGTFASGAITSTGDLSVKTSDGAILNLQTSDTTITDGDVLGQINFQAPNESSGTDAILVGASIAAVAESQFSATNNATELVFYTGSSETAAKKMTLSSDGNLNLESGGSFIIGNASMNETDLEKIDGITDGTAAANKALVVDSNKDIGTIRNLTIDGVLTDGNYTFDTSGNVSGLGTVSSGAITSSGSITAGSSFIIGSADINETDLEKIDGITDGTAAANKALVVDSNKDIGTIRNLTINGVFTDGNYTFDTSGNVSGLGTVSSGAITSSGILTAATGSIIGNLTLANGSITDSSGAISFGNENLTTTGSITVGTSFIIGSADINETDLEKIDGITDGTAAANKALVVDSNKDIGTIRNLTINGTFTDGTASLTSGALTGISSATISSSSPNLIVKSTNTSDGTSLITMISDNAGEAGDGFQFKSLNGVLTIASDHNSVGTYGETIMTITGHDTDASRSVAITGDLSSSKISMYDSNNINVGTGNDMTLYHDGSNSYITNKTGALKIATETSGIAVTIGHSTSEVTISDNMTVAGDITVTGNLIVNGSSTTISSTNTVIQDKLIKLGQGNTGVAHDLGIIFTRGDGSSTNLANRGLIWDESTDIFSFVNCNTEDGTTNGNITINDYASIRVGSITADDASTFTSTISTATGSTIGNLTLANGSITDSSGAISFGNENLTTSGTLASGNLSVTGTGTFSSTISTATGSTVGNLTLANGSITDSSGAISFGNENLTTTGTLASGNLSVTGTGTFSSTISAATGSTVGNLTLANGSITDSSGAISFGNENLSTTGSITAGTSFIIGNADINETDLEKIDGITDGTVVANKALVVDSNKDIGTIRNLTIDGVFTDGNYTFDTSGNVSGLGTISSGAITTSGTLTAATGSTIGNLTLANGSITDSSGAISFGNENLTTTGTLASGNLSVTGTGTFSSTISTATGSTIGNLTLANGSITDSSGAISFGDENLTTTGTLASGNLSITGTGTFSSTLSAATGSSIGNLTLANGSITDSSGTISFGDENLTTTGTLASGNLTISGSETLNNGDITLQTFSADATSKSIIFQKTRSTTSTAHSLVEANDDIGNIIFKASDGDQYLETAKIVAEIDNTSAGGAIAPGDNDMPGRLVFYTTSDGASSSSERLRIDSEGTVIIAGNLSIGGKTNMSTTATKLGGTETFIEVPSSLSSIAEIITIKNLNGEDISDTNVKAITINAASGSIDIDAAATKDVNILGGQLLLSSKQAVANAISLTTNSGADETIVINNTQGTTDGSFYGALVTSADALLAGITTNTTAITTGTQTGKVTSTNGNGSGAILTIVASGTTVVTSVTVTTTGSGYAAGDTLTVAASEIDGSSSDLVFTLDSGDIQGAGAIAVESTAGGIGLSWNDAKDLWAEGGRAIVTANENAAETIKLHADGFSGALVTTADALLAGITTNTTAITTGTQVALATTSNGSGVGAQLTIVASGTTVVTGVTVTTAGSGYAVGDTLTVAAANINGSDSDLVFTLDSGDIQFKTSQTILLVNDEGTSEGAIALTATAGGVDIDAAAGKDVNISGGQLTLSSKTDEASAISLTTNVGTSETIVVTNTKGTDNGAIALTATAGGITMKVADEKELTIGNAAGDAYFKVAASATAGNEDLRIVNTSGTDESAIELTATAGGITMKVADEKNLTMGNADSDAYFKVAASATAGDEDLRIVNTNGTDEAAIALTATAGGVDIDAAATKDVNIAGGQVALVSKDNAASAISLTTNVGTTETIVITNTQGDTDGTAGAGAIVLTSTAGGIGLLWNDAKDLWAEGGRAIVTANENAAEAIKLHADAGANQTIVLVNDAGTDEWCNSFNSHSWRSGYRCGSR